MLPKNKEIKLIIIGILPTKISLKVLLLVLYYILKTKPYLHGRPAQSLWMLCLRLSYHLLELNQNLKIVRNKIRIWRFLLWTRVEYSFFCNSWFFKDFSFLLGLQSCERNCKCNLKGGLSVHKIYWKAFREIWEWIIIFNKLHPTMKLCQISYLFWWCKRFKRQFLNNCLLCSKKYMCF